MTHGTAQMNLRGIMPNEESQIQKATYRIIPRTWHFGKVNSRVREQIDGCQGQGGGGVDDKGTAGGNFGGDKGAMCPDCSSGQRIVCVCQSSQDCAIKTENAMGVNSTPSTCPRSDSPLPTGEKICTEGRKVGLQGEGTA